MKALWEEREGVSKSGSHRQMQLWVWGRPIPLVAQPPPTAQRTRNEGDIFAKKLCD